MAMTVLASISAMAPGLTTSFNAHGGVEPYTYSVVAGGAGGTIDASTGVYTAPAVMNIDPKRNYDTIQAVDSAGSPVTALSSPLLIADPLFLFCEIIAKELGLANDRVWLYNQKKMQPTDAAMFVVVSVLSCKPFANSLSFLANGTNVQSVNMMATLSLNVKSRSIEALLRKEEVLLALNSQYAQSQMELNSFLIGKIPPGSQFVNLSEVDGAAIPYRFNISINMQYMVKKVKNAPYFDQFEEPEVTTDP